MFNRKLVISVVVVFIVSLAFGFLIHGTILHSEYAKLPNLIRSEEAAQKLFGLMFVANLLFAIGFSWIYLRGREAKPWLGQGVRFGIAVAVLSTIPTYLINYIVMPFPSDLVAQQMAFDTIALVVLGIIVAWLNR